MLNIAKLAISLLSILFAVNSVTAQPPQSKLLMAYVGTFSSPLRDTLPTQVDLPPGNGRGIHLFEVDRATGALNPAGVYELGTSPSYLAVNSGGSRLYSANETDRVGEKKEGTVSAFEIDRSTGQLKLLNTVRAGGAGPTFVSIHPSGKFVLVANYFGGSVAVLPIRADGGLLDASDIKNDDGQIGPTKATNAPPGSFAFSGHDRTHAHMIESDPSGRFVLHVDLGLDTILYGSSTNNLASSAQANITRSRYRLAMAQDTFTFIRTNVGSIRFKKRARRLCFSTSTNNLANSQSVKRFQRCHLSSLAVIFVQRSWFRQTENLCSSAIDCMTVSGFSLSEMTAR